MDTARNAALRRGETQAGRTCYSASYGKPGWSISPTWMRML